MRLTALTLTLLTVLFLVSVPAYAGPVKYVFVGKDPGNGIELDLTYTAPDFITAQTVFDAGGWENCSINPSQYTCGHGGFNPNYNHYGTYYDAIEIAILGFNNSEWWFFEPGTFSKLGTFDTIDTGAGTITISDVGATVPEPSELLLLCVSGIVGVVGYGCQRVVEHKRGRRSSCA